jgi:rfaE bifunctional protein kinase chain/domain
MAYKILPDKKILVIGDLMVDHYILGACTRISPEAPVPVVEIASERKTLGGAGNVLKNIQSFGNYADIVSVVGEDIQGDDIRQGLVAAGLLANGIIKDASRCTTIKSRVLVDNHQLIRLDREITKPISDVIEANIVQILKKKICLFDLVLISDYNKGLLTKGLLQNIFTICKKNNVKTILDPKGTDFSKYDGVFAIKPNRKEAEIATGMLITDDESLIAVCKELKRITSAENVIITLSEKGIACLTNKGFSIIPTKAMDIIDVTGAGDTVLASLGIAIVSGNSMEDACDFANHAAAVVVSKAGSATTTLSEIENFYVN